ncbi:MAG TPA: DUF6141 family protein [Alphaproteobacteria bacterium]|nr:DUF6141 family protein [Alphaproteobacteria bacterium]
MTHYTETQGLSGPVLAFTFLLLTIAEGGAFAAILYEYLRRPAMGTPIAPFIVIGVVGLISLFFLLLTRLFIEVRDDGIYHRLGPIELTFRRIAFPDIAQVELVDHNALRDFGGWGKRYRLWGKYKGVCYTLGGDRALAVTLTSGKRLFFGTRRPDELLAAVYAAAGKR